MSRAWGDPAGFSGRQTQGLQLAGRCSGGRELPCCEPSTHHSHRSQTTECQLLPCRLWGRHSTKVHIQKMRLWHQAQPAAAEGGEEGTQTQWQAGAGLHRAAVLGQMLQQLKVAPGDCSQQSWPRQQHRKGTRGAHHYSPKGTAVRLGLCHSRAPTPHPPGELAVHSRFYSAITASQQGAHSPTTGTRPYPLPWHPPNPQWSSHKATITLLPSSPFKL